MSLTKGNLIENLNFTSCERIELFGMCCKNLEIVSSSQYKEKHCCKIGSVISNIHPPAHTQALHISEVNILQLKHGHEKYYYFG